jgi:hypothetical protein
MMRCLEQGTRSAAMGGPRMAESISRLQRFGLLADTSPGPMAQAVALRAGVARRKPTRSDRT